jgi:hypothetical protein
MAGFRSLLAPWIGGARVEPPQPGVRSLLGFWIGGAGLPAAVEPPAPEEAPQVLGGKRRLRDDGEHHERVRRYWDERERATLRHDQNRAAIAMVLAMTVSGELDDGPL